MHARYNFMFFQLFLGPDGTEGETSKHLSRQASECAASLEDGHKPFHDLDLARLLCKSS
jgi:hypothetical protein